MPFKPDLRKRLQDLKSELESGILPKVLYEDMCRNAISEYGVDPFDNASNGNNGSNYARGNLGETVALLTPAQQTILEAIGDIDLSLIIPHLRKLRKKILRTSSQLGNISKNRVECPECSKEFMNTQGLSTHLLAKHRRALDDFYQDQSTRKFLLKPEGWKPIESLKKNDTDSRLETADTMANLVSAALDQSTGGDGLWIVKQVRDSDSDDDDDDEDDEDSALLITSTKKPQPTNAPSSEYSSTKALEDLAKLANIPVESSISNKDSTQENLIASNNSNIMNINNFNESDYHREDAESAVHTRDIHGSDDNSTEGGKTDRRKNNRGTKVRKSYSKDTKLSVIGMRDQGKCTDEISAVMGIPKSNVEKWCSAKGREKILLDIYRDVVSQRPRLESGRPSDVAKTSLAQQLPPPPGMQTSNKPATAPFNALYSSRETQAASQLFGENVISYTRNYQDTGVSSLSNTNMGQANSVAIPTVNGHAYKVAVPNSTYFLNNPPPSFNANQWSYSTDGQPKTSIIPQPVDSQQDKRQRTDSGAARPVLPSQSIVTLPLTATVPKSKPTNPPISSGKKTAKPGSKRKPTPSSTATAAAAVAQSISFNNDGFSDSDDDNEVMGLLGEQMPIVALHRLTQMRPL